MNVCVSEKLEGGSPPGAWTPSCWSRPACPGSPTCLPPLSPGLFQRTWGCSADSAGTHSSSCPHQAVPIPRRVSGTQGDRRQLNVEIKVPLLACWWGSSMLHTWNSTALRRSTKGRKAKNQRYSLIPFMFAKQKVRFAKDKRALA